MLELLYAHPPLDSTLTGFVDVVYRRLSHFLGKLDGGITSEKAKISA